MGEDKAETEILSRLLRTLLRQNTVLACHTLQGAHTNFTFTCTCSQFLKEKCNHRDRPGDRRTGFSLYFFCYFFFRLISGKATVNGGCWQAMTMIQPWPAVGSSSSCSFVGHSASWLTAFKTGSNICIFIVLLWLLLTLVTRKLH